MILTGPCLVPGSARMFRSTRTMPLVDADEGMKADSTQGRGSASQDAEAGAATIRSVLTATPRLVFVAGRPFAGGRSSRACAWWGF
jgi:hypothetical protein